MKALECNGFVTPRDYTLYCRFNILKGRLYRVKTISLAVLLVAVCLLLAICGLAYSRKALFVVAGIILLCALMFAYVMSVNVKNICNSKAKIVRATQHTVFGKNGVIFELLFEKTPDENEYSEIFFDEIDCIYDGPKAIYIYIEKRSVLVLPKRNLNMSPAEAREFLKKYVPAQKLVICV